MRRDYGPREAAFGTELTAQLLTSRVATCDRFGASVVTRHAADPVVWPHARRPAA
jgi:hypothetical protein